MIAEQLINRWGQVIVKAQQDDGFRKRLLADPTTALKECDMDFPACIQLQVHENTGDVVHLTIPAKSTDGELSDVDLAGVSGGALSIIAILIGMLCPTAQQDTTYDPIRVFGTSRK